jgi:large subunit ribosomal protein L21
MYAIVKTGGMQFKVSPFDVVRVPKLAHGENEELKLGEVLFIRSGESMLVGRPTVEGAEVTAKILRHGRYRKVQGFKFKKRKKYRRKWGAREAYTEMVITGISAPGMKPEVEERPEKGMVEKRTPVKKEAPAKVQAGKRAGKPKEKKAKGTGKAKG